MFDLFAVRKRYQHESFMLLYIFEVVMLKVSPFFFGLTSTVQL